jgi:hypothetical protein
VRVKWRGSAGNAVSNSKVRLEAFGLTVLSQGWRYPMDFKRKARLG